ncbi:MAG: hypothetical protein HC859_06000 [Bacteroidia bacterium]|nr:hypothetical protein [Bacteroidia bacterium]
MVDFDTFEENGVVVQTANSDPFLFIEPSFIGKVNFGNSPILMNFQAGFNYSTQGRPYFDYQHFHLSLGFGVRFGGKHKTEEE